MLHFILAFYILTFTLAVAVSLLAFLLAKKYHSILYIYTGLIFLGSLIHLLAHIVSLYKFTIGNNPYSTLSLEHYLLVLIGGFLMLYFTPLLIFRVTNLPFTKLKQFIHISFLMVVLFTLIFEYLNYREAVKIMRDILYAIIFTYSALVILRNYKKVKSIEVQLVLKSFGILILVIIPLILIHKFIVLHFFPDNISINFPYFNVLFLLGSTSLAIYYGAKYLFKREEYTYLELSKNFMRIANISQREQEIIQLLVEGLSNKEIADSLFISQKTVKNHLYHIYRKLGINSRLQLMHKLIESS